MASLARKNVAIIGALVVVLIGAALFVVLPAVSDDDDSASNNLNALAKTTDRSFTGGKFAFGIDGAAPAFVAKASGGAIFADVIEEKGAGGQGKHLGSPKIEPVQFELGAGTPKNIWDWVTDSVAQKVGGKDAALQ